MEIDKSLSAPTTTLIPSTKVSTSPRSAIAVAPAEDLAVTTSTLVNGVSPMSVGREFVRQYYTMMGKSPKNLYRFYSSKSTLTIGNNKILIGQDQIRKDIEKRKLSNCHAYIIKIDSQRTLGNGVVVQVIGKLSNNSEPLRPFTQTFVLSPHIPKNFYVNNEIFRYQDELYPEISLEALKLPISENQHNKTTDHDHISKDLQESCNSLLEAPVTHNTKFPLMSQNDPVIFVSHRNQQKKNIPEGSIQNECKLEIQQDVVSIEQTSRPISMLSKTETQKQKTLKEHIENDLNILFSSNDTQSKPSNSFNLSTYDYEECKTQPQKGLTVKNDGGKTKNIIEIDGTAVAKPQLREAAYAPMTYANVFKSSSGLLQNSLNKDAKTNSKNGIDPIFIRSAIFTSSSSPFASSANNCSVGKPTNDKNSRGLKISKDKRAERTQNIVVSNKTVGANVVKSASFHQQRSARQEGRERYDEGLELFLGNLPVTATPGSLIPIFERYGTILELRVLSKCYQPGMKKPPNYGFLTYDCPEAVQRCLKDGPYYFPENTRNGVRLNVRLKNNDENQLTQTVKPQISSFSVNNIGGSFDKSSNSSFEKRDRLLNIQGNGPSGDAALDTQNTKISGSVHNLSTTSEENSLLMEDWPQLCVQGNEGSGCSMSAGIRRIKD